MLTLLCFFAAQPARHVQAGLPSGSNSFYVGNKSPLKPSAFYKLPIGAIQPQGWLNVELTEEAAGETGHLEEISPWLDRKNNAWLSSTGAGDHGWEEVPYWLKGFGDLGYILKDRRIIDHAKFWVNGVLGSQRSNGYFGPESNLTANDGKPDVWPNMVMTFALQSYYEWSKDPRVLPFLTRYFQWEQTIPDQDMFLSYWEKQRGGDNIESVYWLYNRTGNATLLDLVRKIHRAGADWVKGVPNWHGVNFAQGFREPEQFSELDPSTPGVTATESDYELMKKLYGQVPGGMYGADENVREGYHDPRQGTETCAMVEMMLSDELLLTADGDPKWADRCEDVAFNSLPGALTSDEKALHYLTAPNLVEADARSKAPGFQNSGPMLLFNPYDQRCCQHNVSHGWPFFAEHLWLGTGENGLAATLYAPNTVKAQVGDGQTVTIEEKTEYPFRDKVRFLVHTSSPVKFPLSLRVPGWAVNPSVTIDGEKSELPAGPSFCRFDRLWKDGDAILLTLPMNLSLRTWAQNGGAVTVDRGPLSYGLEIGEKLVKSMGTKEFPATEKYPAWEIHPTTAWNYGLIPDLKKFTVVEKPFDANRQPFALDNLAVEVKAPARVIPEWQEDLTGLCSVLQKSPALSVSPVQTVTLVPMSAARLRISEFPTVSTDSQAIQWVAPRKALPPIPASSSHTNDGDTVAALSSGFTPMNSHDEGIPRFTWWDRKGSEEWVEYDFPTARKVSSSSVYWFDDEATGGGCRVPASWRIEFWADGKWLPVEPTGAFGLRLDTFNQVRFTQVRTEKLRIVARLQPEYSGGILQWQIGQ